MIEFFGLRQQRQRLHAGLIASIEQVLERGDYIGGREVVQLERALSSHYAGAYCLACGSGSDALALALITWGVHAGDAVFMPSYSTPAVAAAVVMRGATPIFVDVDETLNLCADSLEQQLKQVLREGRLRPTGVVAANLFGVVADYQQIGKVTARQEMWLLEDGAQSFGAQRYGQSGGTFGDISTVSFSPKNPLGGYGDGGALITKNHYYAQALEVLRCHGRRQDNEEERMIGLSTHLDTLQAAILLKKLAVFEEELLARQKTAALYHAALGAWVTTPTVPKDCVCAWAQYAIRLKNRQQRDQLRLRLSTKGIPTAVYCKKPLHLQGAFSHLGYCRGALLKSEAVADTLLCLPMHGYLTEEQALDICQGVKEGIL